MITLKRLKVPALKHLRDVDLWLPRRGATLIEGPNESGKSTLFEAIYFGLYGRPLVGEDPRPTLASLIPHDETQAQVTLTVVSGDVELDITRTLNRARNGSVSSEASLVVRQPGKADERINAVSAVNDRILAELRALDGDTLRNSCFMEQKGLERLESLKREDREIAISRLLGLERLVDIERSLDPTSEERRELDRLRTLERIARQRRLSREANQRAGDVAQRLQAAEARQWLDERDLLATQLQIVTENDQRTQEELRTNDDLLAGIDRLHATERRLIEIERTRWQAKEIARENGLLTSRLDELDAIAAAQAPEARQRLDDIQRIETGLREAEHERSMLVEAESLVARIHQFEQAQRHAQTMFAEADAIRASSAMTLAKAQARDTLAAWILARQRQDIREGRTQQLAALKVERGKYQQEMHEIRAQAWQWLAMTGAALGMALLTAIIAIAVHLAVLWGVVVMSLIAAAGLAYRWRQETTASRARAWKMSQADHGITSVSAERNLAQRLVNDDIGRLEARLRLAGMPIPESAEEGERILNSLAPVDANPEMETNARAAEAEATRAQIALERSLEDANGARAGLFNLGFVGPTDEIPQRLEKATAQANALREEARSLELPEDLAGLAAARGAAEAQFYAIRSHVGNREEVHTQLLDSATSLEDALQSWASELQRVGDDLVWLGLIDGFTLPEPLETTALDHLHVEFGELTQRTLAQQDETAIRTRHATLLAERQRLADEGDAAREERSRLHAIIRERMAEFGVVAQGDEPLETMAERCPLLAAVTAADIEQLRDEQNTARMVSYHSEQTAAEHEIDVPQDTTPLDEESARARRQALERDLRLRTLARDMASEARARIIRRALPETEIYMRAILPELTAGRYRDVTLTRDDSTSANGETDIAIRMWDEQASRYVRKNLFSGGTRDQASLALRLAFALATLPKEHGATPGFIFLDEPLSAFDNERSLALARILTSGAIAQAFAQVFLISHNRVIDARSFTYTLRMENGRVAHSTLPTKAIAEALWEAESEIGVDAETPRPLATAKSREASGGVA